MARDRGITESGRAAGVRRQDDMLQPGDTVSYYPDGSISAGLRYSTILDVKYNDDEPYIDDETMLKLKDEDGTVHDMSISELNPDSLPQNIGPRTRIRYSRQP